MKPTPLEITPEELAAMGVKVNGKAGPSTPIPEGPPWPKPLSGAALYGLAGEFVRLAGPETEADPAALLVQFLVAFGNVVGRTPYFQLEGVGRHYLNLYAVLVGATARGRKGTSWDVTRTLFDLVDSEWAGERVVSGLSSGEGLIHAVRDATEEQQPIKDPKTKRVTGHQTVVSDAGVGDKRLTVVEPEFSSALKAADRDGNTLSAVLRQAWDSGTLRILTRNRPAKATGAHISVIAHITQDELLRHLSTTDTANGFANRFLWTAVRRSKKLPRGGKAVDLTAILARLSAAVQFARVTGRMAWDSEAGELWDVAYEHLSCDRPGLLGAITTRAEAITLRLSCVYALLDCSAVVRAEHLAAALEVWRYCEDSARFIFGDALGDATADTILAALMERPEGMTRTDLRNLFDRHKSAEAIGRALAVLQRAGLARSESEPTGGKPAERWFAA